jgi:hypothetical protein
MACLAETGNRGAAPRYTSETGRRILATLDGPLPAGHGRWTAPLIAAALGDVHEQYVWRFLRAQKIDLAGRKSWCVSHDPEFAAKAAEVVGLYLDPPEGALVVAIDDVLCCGGSGLIRQAVYLCGPKLSQKPTFESN